MQKGWKIFAPSVERNSVKSDFDVLKRFSYENRLRFETKQQLLLKQKEDELKVYQARLADGSARSRRKKGLLKKHVHQATKGFEGISKNQKYTLYIMGISGAQVRCRNNTQTSRDQSPSLL